jgi:major membrane immunogen (membrane-anchored lipoprotein)
MISEPPRKGLIILKQSIIAYKKEHHESLPARSAANSRVVFVGATTADQGFKRQVQELIDSFERREHRHINILEI